MTMPSRDAAPSRGFIGLVVVGVVVAVVRLFWAGASDVWVGADSFYYTALADSLATGRGFVVDYVRFFFDRYPTVHGRVDDWLSPLYPLSMVPFIKVFGHTYLAYSAPSILASSLGLPLVTRALARRLGVGELPAVLAGYTAMVHPTIFLNAQHPMSDVPFTVLVGLCFYWFLRCDEGVRPGVYAGVFLGLAMLTRPVGPWLIPILPLCHALRMRQVSALIAPPMLAMVAVGLILFAPWMIRNQVVFGSAGYSVYGYQGPMAGRRDLGIDQAYAMWWDCTPPRMADRYLHGEGAWAMALTHLVWAFDMCFVGLIKSANRTAIWGLDHYNYHLYHAALGLPALAMLWLRRQVWETWFCALLIGSLAAAISLVNIPAMPRYFFPVWPLILAYGWLGLEQMSERAGQRLGGQRLWLVAICLVLFGGGGALDIWRGRQMQVPHDPAGRAQLLDARLAAIEAGARSEPMAVLLAEANPAMTNHYSQRPTVAVPGHATAADIAAVVAQYQIRHAVVKRGSVTAEALLAAGWRPWFEVGQMVGLVAGE